MEEILKDKINHFKHILYVLSYSQDCCRESAINFVNGEIEQCEKELVRLKKEDNE